eukprot:4807735-Amphidinium_carterae.1
MAFHFTTCLCFTRGVSIAHRKLEHSRGVNWSKNDKHALRWVAHFAKRLRRRRKWLIMWFNHVTVAMAATAGEPSIFSDDSSSTSVSGKAFFPAYKPRAVMASDTRRLVSLSIFTVLHTLPPTSRYIQPRTGHPARGSAVEDFALDWPSHTPHRWESLTRFFVEAVAVAGHST